MGVSVEQAEGDLVEGGLYRRDLCQDIYAVAVVRNHALDATHLALNAAKSRQQLILGRHVAADRACGLRPAHGEEVNTHTLGGYARFCFGGPE